MTKFLSVILISILALGMSACRDTKDPPPQDTFIIIPADPVPPLEIKAVDFEVWNLDRIVKEAATTSNKDRIYYVLTAEQATNLLDNLVDISDNYAKTKKSIIYYENAIKEYQEAHREEDE